LCLRLVRLLQDTIKLCPAVVNCDALCGCIRLHLDIAVPKCVLQGICDDLVERERRGVNDVLCERRRYCD
jgi:hypothetical protein